MAEQPTIDRNRTAVVIMDYQTAIVTGFANESEQQALLNRAARVLTAARDRGLPVIYVTVGFRPGYPEVSPRNASFSAIKETGRFGGGAPGAEIHPTVAPHPGDVTVVKHRVGAFAGTDFEMVLRAKDVDTLVVFGVATSGCVLSTVRHAADADYRMIVLRDCCADRDAEVHNCLIDKIFPRQSTVLSAEEFIAALGNAA